MLAKGQNHATPIVDTPTNHYSVLTAAAAEGRYDENG